MSAAEMVLYFCQLPDLVEQLTRIVTSFTCGLERMTHSKSIGDTIKREILWKRAGNMIFCGLNRDGFVNLNPICYSCS